MFCSYVFEASINFKNAKCFQIRWTPVFAFCFLNLRLVMAFSSTGTLKQTFIFIRAPGFKKGIQGEWKEAVSKFDTAEVSHRSGMSSEITVHASAIMWGVYFFLTHMYFLNFLFESIFEFIFINAVLLIHLVPVRPKICCAGNTLCKLKSSFEHF